MDPRTADRPRYCTNGRCRNPVGVGSDSCPWCAMKRAASDGDRAECLAIAEDNGLPQSSALAILRAELDRANRAEAKRLYAVVS